MTDEITELKPHKSDLVVVPENFTFTIEPDFLVCRLKYLHQPSIVRSGGYGGGGMGFLGNLGIHSLEWIHRLGRINPVKSNVNETNVVNIQPSLKGNETMSATEIAVEEPVVKNEVVSGALKAIVTKLVPTEPEHVVEVTLPESFLRHVRPTKKAKKLSEVKTELESCGGATIAVDLYFEEKFFLFTFAICSKRDNFNKRRAAGICQDRSKNLDKHMVINYDESHSIVSNVYHAIQNHFKPAGSVLTGPILKTSSARKNNEEVLKKLAETILSCYNDLTFIK